MPNSASQPPTDAQIEAAMLALVTARGPNASACPSEVARKLLLDSWRELMPSVRRVAANLAQRGSVEITQAGMTVEPTQPFKGPIRIRIRIRIRQGSNSAPDS